MRIGELFAGYGGLGMGVQTVMGGSVAWVSDIDKGANKILAHRFPSIPNIGDITTVDWSAVEPVDVLCGGSPCQDLSHAGKRQGMTEGTRSNLWVAMREAIAQLRPRYVVWENVRGAGSAEATSELEFCPGCMGDPWYRGTTLRALGRVVGDLSDLGYVGQVRGVRASDVGAPHGRFRYFLLTEDADRVGERNWATAPLPERRPGSSLRPDGSDRRTDLPPTHTSTDATNTRITYRSDADNLTLLGALLPTPAVNDMGAGKTVEDWDDWTDDMKARHGNGNGHGKSLAIEAQRLLPTPKATNNENRQSEGRSERANFHGLLRGHQQWGMYAAAINRWELILGRPAPEPTRTSSKGNPQLSAHFVEFLMGLPAGWVTDVPGITRNEALKALGNGVVPAQAAAALRTMLAWEAVAS